MFFVVHHYGKLHFMTYNVTHIVREDSQREMEAIKAASREILDRECR